ncbi:MAG TPA: tandem-95 repeat protein, partial [Armatimonadota bacterium]|nr:tandem-95 repeat protein [Armatimonadota bacterium]
MNYLRGNDPGKWRKGLPTYAKVHYESVYPGIDMVYYGNQNQLEYDFILAPGAAPEQIRLSYTGAEQVELDDRGDLLLRLAGGQVRQHKPIVYQEIEGARREVEGEYVLYPPAETAAGASSSDPGSKGPGSTRVGFRVAEYDQTRPLVIDPVVAYSTYVGSSRNDRGEAIAVDGAGSAYITGSTEGLDFPVLNALQPVKGGDEFQYPADAYVVKLDPSGTSLVYATYLGGNNIDHGTGIAVSANGAVCVTGSTLSTDFPTANPLQPEWSGTFYSDAFVAKLDPAGASLVYSTYLGGGQSDNAFAVALDPAGNAYVTGQTASPNFPLHNALQREYGGSFVDAFVTKISSDGSAFVFSTYLGGTGTDVAYGIAVDREGHCYLTGRTDDPGFPITNRLPEFAGDGWNDGFVCKFAADGASLDYSFLLDAAYSYGIAVDAAGHAYVTGIGPIGVPVAAPVQSGPDAFVAKVNPGGTALVYATTFGGSDRESPRGVAVDSTGAAVVAGWTESRDFPAVSAVQPVFGGGYYDAFVTRFTPDGSRFVYSTYLGGSGHDYGYGVAVDGVGDAYVVGYTTSADFPTLNAFQPAHRSPFPYPEDAFVTRLAAVLPETPLPPEAPSSLVAEATSPRRIHLSWRDNSQREEGFRIERAAAGGPFALLATAGANTVSFDDTVNAGTTYRYRSRAFIGTRSSAYSNEASATTPPAPPPLSQNDAFTVVEDTILTVAAPGILRNDSDPEGEPLTALLLNGPAHGRLTLNQGGSFTYAPDANYSGSDSFTYRASDGALFSSPATVTLTVSAVNDPPGAAPDSFRTNEDTPLTATAPGVLRNDTDAEGTVLTAVLVTGPSHGTLQLAVNGSFTYTPGAHFHGTDQFVYRASDSRDSSTAVVTLTVVPVNDAPSAGNDAYATSRATPLTVAARGVLANDEDVEGTALTAVLAGRPANGSVTLNLDGSFTYRPRVGFHGSDAFTYRASDGASAGNLATVTVAVSASFPPSTANARVSGRGTVAVSGGQ